MVIATKFLMRFISNLKIIWKIQMMDLMHMYTLGIICQTKQKKGLSKLFWNGEIMNVICGAMNIVLMNSVKSAL